MSNELNSVEIAEVSEHSAHNILNYCITQSVLKNTNTNFKVQIPYEVLAKSCNVDPVEAAKYFGSALELTVKLRWVESDDDAVEFEHE